VRDYFLHPAQTNLELYAQILDSGYDARQRRRVADAYQFALHQVYPLARGSGKPFICHLVGTASLVLASGCAEDVVIAAVLHALYQRRIPFAGGLPPPQRRPVVAGAFGTAVDDLIEGYTAFEDARLGELDGDFAADNAELVTLRLADELEDLCGNAIALHGSPGKDQPAIAGDVAWRRANKTREADYLIGAARSLGLAGLARGLSFWLDFSSAPGGLSDMRTGWFSSIDLSQNR
jgi:hypothetical protein